MGLHAKSKSLPKLSAKVETKEGLRLKMDSQVEDKTKESKSHLRNVDIIRLDSGREAGTAYYEELTVEKANSGRKKTELKRKDKLKSEQRNGISGRIRVLFQSLFNLDKKSKDSLISSQTFGWQLDSNFEIIENMAYVKCRSMPELNKLCNGTKIVKKSVSFRHQKPFFSSLLRRSRRKLNSFRDRHQSDCSLQGEMTVDSCSDITSEDKWLRKKQRAQSATQSDISAPNSPVLENFPHCFHNSPENSPVFTKESPPVFSKESIPKARGFLPNNENRSMDRARLRRERFRRSKTTGPSFMGIYASTSLSESSDIAEEAEIRNEAIIANASTVAQRRRKTFNNNRSKTLDLNEKKESENLPKTLQSGTVSQCKNGTSSCEDVGYTQELRDLVEEELKAQLSNKEFDPDQSTACCRTISECIRIKIQQATKGVYKVVVQAFIGAVEEDGIITALQCNLNPESDGFAAVSYRNESLFAFASVLAVEFTEK